MTSTADGSAGLPVPALSPRLVAALPAGVLLGAALMALVLINVTELASPLSTDQALYSFIGHEVRQGYLPCGWRVYVAKTAALS